MDFEMIDAAVRDLMKRKRWYEWPKAQSMGVDEFQEAVTPEIEAMLAGFHFDAADFEEIAARLWRRLRNE